MKITPFIDLSKPTLLGLSGGPDSMALLQRALDEGIPNLHLAHIDHAWRSSSAAEAEELSRLAKKLNLPFHLKRLEKPTTEANLEDLGRQARLTFFQELYQKLDCGALLLGHHLDDQAETVLKRLFEGASLPKLRGMQHVVIHRQMRIVRPFLSVPKSSLKTTYTPIDDPTNRDPKYLRSRMRTTLIPALEHHFGKSIARNLSRLSTRAADLTAYLDRRIAPHTIHRGPHGALIDTDLSHIDPFEWRYLISTLASLTSSQLDTATNLQQSTGIVPLELHDLHIDRGRIILTDRAPFTTAPGAPIQHTWQHLILYRPHLLYNSGTPTTPRLRDKLPTGESLSEHYRKLQVPTFLRQLLPVIENSEGITTYIAPSQHSHPL